MSTSIPIYRVTGYQRRSVDVNEAIVLTPAGSPPVHTKPFRMATKAYGRAVRIGATTVRRLEATIAGTWPTTAFSLEFVGRLDSGLSQSQINTAFSYTVAAGLINEIWLGVFTSGGQWRLGIDVDNFGTTFDADAYPNDNKYHHVVATWQASDGAVKLYIDGVLAHSGTNRVGDSISGGGGMVLGQDQDSLLGGYDATQAWKGELDEVRVYSRVLSATEVMQHFAGQFMDETGLCARWGFDDPYFVGRDSSASGNHLLAFGIPSGTEDTVLHFEPFMFPPGGRLGAMDLRSKRVGVGSMAVEFQDQRVTAGGVNSDRFLTAFFGDGKGTNRMAGTRLFFEQSFDDGLTWGALFTGRVQTTKLVGKLKYEVSVRDLTEDLKRMKLFVSAPHPSANNASVASLLPVGFIKPYGSQPVVTPLRATLALNRTVSYQGVNFTVNLLTLITGTPSAPNVARLDNVFTQNLLDAIQPLHTGAADDNPIFRMANGAKAHIKINGGAQNGQEGDVRVGLLNANTMYSGGIHRVLQLTIMTLDTTEPSYIALPADSTSVDFYVYPENEISNRNPLLINDSPLGRIWRDVLDGYFAERWTWLDRNVKPANAVLGDPKYKVPYVSAAFDAIIADTRVPPLRFLETDAANALDWLEKNIFVMGFSYRFDGFGRVVPVDLRMPVAADVAGIPTVVDADLEDGEDSAEWEQERTESLSRARIFTYVDTPIGIGELQPRGDPHAPNSLPIIEFAMLQPQAVEALAEGLGSLDVGDQEERIEYRGLRSMLDETVDGLKRTDWAEAKARGAVQHLKRPFGNGAQPGVLKCRRTASTDLSQGRLAIVTVSWLPDPATYRRGGSRLVRITDRVESGGAGRTLHVIDLGLSGAASVPTLGAPAQQTGNRLHGVKMAVTRNGAGDDVEVWAAVTETSVAVAPLETSSLWVLADVVRGANRDATFWRAPAGKRVWLRARSVPTGDAETPTIPSAFVAASSFVDTVALTAPTSPVEISKSARAFRVGWTPQASVVDGTSYFFGVEVLLATPVGDTRTVYRRLPVGTTFVDVLGAEPSTTYRVGIRHYDGLGGVSSEITIDVTTTASAVVAPAMRAISVVEGSLT